MKFVIFHGSLGSNQGNWFPDLKNKLEAFNQTVICPQYSVDVESEIKPDKSYQTVQNLDSWMLTFEKEVLPKLSGKDKISFVAHSMGNLFVLHVIEKYKIKLDCAIFVSPFVDRLSNVPLHYQKVNETFYKYFDFTKLHELIPTSYVLYSENDPYVEPVKAKQFAELLDSSLIFLRKAKHMNAEVNLYEFPLVFDLCLTRIDFNRYQRFLYDRKIKDYLSFLIDSERKFIKLSADEIKDEGKFHYLNLTKSGFATYPSDTFDWDPECEFFRTAREKSKSGVNIVRVIIIKDPKHLKLVRMKRQIELDLAAGIEIRLIDNQDYRAFKCPEDFGIWDNEYVAIVDHAPDSSITGGTVDSRVKTMLTAQNWRDRILRGSKKVESLKDLKTD